MFIKCIETDKPYFTVGKTYKVDTTYSVSGKMIGTIDDDDNEGYNWNVMILDKRISISPMKTYFIIVGRKRSNKDIEKLRKNKLKYIRR